VTELGFHAERARLVLFSEFSFKRSMVSGPKFFVPRVFFQKICGFRARVQADRAGVLSIEVLKPRSLLKLSPQSRGPKNYSRPQSHTFTFLLTESRVLSPDQSRSQVPTPGFKDPTDKKKPGPGRAAPKCVEPRE
jgi:hypothetical protein